MSDFDWEQIRRSKELHRAQAAARPFKEKLQILERMRERTREMRGDSRPPQDRSAGSNLHVFNASEMDRQSASGTVRLGIFGANVVLFAAATSGDSGTRATIVQLVPVAERDSGS
jgi:hypothetical protein